MVNDMSQIEVEAYDYVRKLTGKDSIMLSTKQTSVRLDTSNLVKIDALAEMGKKSRNQIINDALYFGLRLIEDQFEEKDKKQLIELMQKLFLKLGNEDNLNLKSKVK